MPLSAPTQPTLKFANEDAFIEFAKQPCNHQHLLSQPVMLYGVPLRIELEPDRLVARSLQNAGGQAAPLKPRFERMLQAVVALFAPRWARQKQQTRQRADPEWVANRVTEIMQDHPIFRVNDPLRAMIHIIRQRDHGIDKALLHCRDQHEAMGLPEQFVDLVDPPVQSSLEEKRVTAKANAPASARLANIDNTIGELAPDRSEAEHIRRNLHNGLLCRQNFLGVYIGDTEVPADASNLPAAEAVDLWFAVDNKGKLGRTRRYREHGEDKVEVRSLSAEERDRFMSGDLRGNRIRIRIRSDVACWFLFSLLESNPALPFHSLSALLDRLQAYRSAYERQAVPDAAMKPGTLAANPDGKIRFQENAAIRLTKARWDGHIADVNKVFQVAHRLGLHECTEAQAAAEIPLVFADLFTERIQQADGQHVRVLRDPARFLSLQDRKEEFLAQLYNEELKRTLLPFHTAGITPQVRVALPLPYVFHDIISLEHSLANDPTVLTNIMERASIRVSGHDYRIQLTGHAPDAIRVLPHDNAPSESGKQMSAALTEVLSRESSIDKLCGTAADQYKKKAEQVLRWWKKTVEDRLSAACDGFRTTEEVCVSNNFRTNTFSHFEKSKIPGTFIAVFGKDKLTQQRITLPDRNAEGHLSGEELKRRIKEGPLYNSLKELAARWALDYYGTEIRKDLTQTLETILARNEVGKDASGSELAALGRRVASMASLTMAPFSDMRLSDFLNEPAGFTAMAALKSFAQDASNRAYLAKAGQFDVRGRTFHIVRRHDAGGSLAINEERPSFVQGVKRLFGLDDGSLLAKAFTVPSGHSDMLRA